MEFLNCCCCCLSRPRDKRLKEPYTGAGKTEIFSQMLKECFEINLLVPPKDACGICEECVCRLRDARDFKLQVQHSQEELRARLQCSEKELRVRLERIKYVKAEEPTVKLEMSDDEVKDEDTAYSDVEDIKWETLDSFLPEDSGELSETQETPEGDSKAALKLTRRTKRSTNTPLGRKRLTITDPNQNQKTQEPETNSEITTYLCATCGLQFSSQQSLFGHQASHKRAASAPVRPEIVCPVCNKRFPTKYRLKLHSKRHETQVPCPYCDRLCRNQLSVDNHIRAKHRKFYTGIKAFSCEQCDKKFVDRSSLNLHKKAHSAEKKFICDFCKKLFKYKTSLDAHIGKHLGQALYACEFCPLKFFQYHNLWTHKLAHTGYKYKCDQCNMEFISKNSLISHIVVKHNGKNPYICEICNLQFRSQPSLYKHRLSHKGPKVYPCELCDKKYRSLTHYKEHVRSHTGERPYFCEKCGRQFVRLDALKTHKKSHERKEFSCEMCCKSFVTQSSLKQHICIHMDNKVFF